MMLKHTFWHGVPWSEQGGTRDLTGIPAPDLDSLVALAAQVVTRGGGTPPYACVAVGRLQWLKPVDRSLRMMHAIKHYTSQGRGQ